MKFNIRNTFFIAFTLLTLSSCDGPLAVFPGGKLLGPETTYEREQLPAELGVIQLETRPSDPYSVNVGCVVIDNKIYIDPTVERTWYQHILSEPNIRIRFEGDENVYLMTAITVKDAAIRAKFESDRIVLRLTPRLPSKAG